MINRSQQGLVPSNYLVPIDDEEEAPAVTSAPAPVPTSSNTAPATKAAPAASNTPSAVAQYDYEAGEDNELSFPEHAVITNIVGLMHRFEMQKTDLTAQEFPDDDWWQGEYNGKTGLFPAAYVELQQ